jgi:hypothetical protein
MLKKVTGLARILGILLSIVAALVAIPGFDVLTVLVVFGLIAGITAAREQVPNLLIASFALPAVGAALANLPAVGTQLSDIFNNLGTNVGGAAAMAVVIMLYNIVMGDVKGLGASSS